MFRTALVCVLMAVALGGCSKLVPKLDQVLPDSRKDYLKAKTLPDLVQQLSQRRYGARLKVGDAFSGMGSIPFEAAELGCDVYASDLNPVACLLTWGALNLIGGSDEFRECVHQAQRAVYNEVDRWLLEKGLETSEEGWRAEAYLYCCLLYTSPSPRD